MLSFIEDRRPDSGLHEYSRSQLDARSITLSANSKTYDLLGIPSELKVPSCFISSQFNCLETNDKTRLLPAKGRNQQYRATRSIDG